MTEHHSTYEEVLALVLAELTAARANHPKWPDDMVHAAAIVAEEAGELVRAALHYTYEDADPIDMQREAAHTAAMGIRFLLHLRMPEREWYELDV